jgi:ubiquinol-cytochrome c reductase cytochrome b subunit
VLLPFADRSPYRGMRKRPVAVGMVMVAVVGLFYLTDLRRRSPWTGWPDPEPPGVPEGFVLTAEAEAGRQLFAQFGCNSCHPVAGRGRQFAVDLAWAGGGLSLDEIRKYILQPPAGVAMPAYEGRLTEEQLSLVAEYVHVAQTFPRE